MEIRIKKVTIGTVATPGDLEGNYKLKKEWKEHDDGSLTVRFVAVHKDGSSIPIRRNPRLEQNADDE